jgi:hypothetical protein
VHRVESNIAIPTQRISALGEDEMRNILSQGDALEYQMLSFLHGVSLAAVEDSCVKVSDVVIPTQRIFGARHEDEIQRILPGQDVSESLATESNLSRLRSICCTLHELE